MPDLLRQAVHELSIRCDGANSDDGEGFNKMDSRFGKSLDAATEWSPKQRRAAWRMVAKYRGQLAGFGINYDDIPTPEVSPEVVPVRYMAVKDGEIIIVFDYRQHIVEALKEFSQYSRRYDPDTKNWFFIPSPSIIQDVQNFAKEFEFDVDPAVNELLEGLAEKQDRMQEGSRAESSDFSIEGLGGELYPFQVAGVEYAVKANRTFIADQQGLGKTVEGLAVIHAKESFPAVVICPATARYVWAKHALIWLPGRTVAMVKGREFFRVMLGNAGRPYLEKDEHNLPGAYDIIIINYENLKPRPNRWTCFSPFTNPKGKEFKIGDYINERLKGFTKDALDLVKRHFKRDGYGRSKNGLIEKLLKINIQALILDESQKVKEHRSQRTQGCTQLSRGVPVRLLLTGTPLLNRPSELISQLAILDRLDEFGGFWAFAQKYCGAYRGRFGLVMSGAKNLPELNRLLRGSCYIRRLKSEVLPDLPPKQRANIMVELDNRPEYAEAKRDLIAWLKENAKLEEEFIESLEDVDEDQQTVMIADYRQTKAAKAARALALNRIENLKQMAAKGKMAQAIQWIKDFLDTGENLIVFASHIEIQKGLLAEFDGAAHILGEDNTDVREANEVRFQSGKCQLIVCSLKVAQLAITLTAASDVMFIEQGWTPADHDQAEDRCHRIGQEGVVNAWYLLAQDSIDMDIQELIAEKRIVVDAATEGREVEGPQTSVLTDLIGRMIK